MPKDNKGIPAGTLTILIRPYQGRYIAMCKETGLIREAESIDLAREAIFGSTMTLLKQVKEDASLEPSLRLGLSFKMKVFYRWSILTMSLLRMAKIMHETFFIQGSVSQFPALMKPVHG